MKNLYARFTDISFYTDSVSANNDYDVDCAKKVRSGLAVRRCSDSTLNYSNATSSPRCGSEFEWNKTADASRSFAVDVDDHGKPNEAPLYHHQAQQSTDSQKLFYKNEILRVSKRHYGITDSGLTETFLPV